MTGPRQAAADRRYRDRSDRLADRITVTGATVAVVGSAAGMAYLTGSAFEPLERFFGLVVRPGRDPVLIVPRVDAALARANPAGVAVEEWTEPGGPAAALARVLERGDVVGIEKRTLTVAYAELLQEAGGAATFVDVSPEIDGLRRRKDEHELAAVRAASAAIDGCMAAMPELLRPGRTELQIAVEIRRLALDFGATVVYQPIVLTGERASDPHAPPGGAVLAEGETVLVDFECNVGGYYADCTRNFALGEPPSRTIELLAVVAEAAAAARAMVAPGVTGDAVDAAARRVITAAGHGEAFVHRTGHGLGLDAHEAPFLAHGDEQPLEAGAVVAVEPGIYLPGVAGVRIEDVVVVTDGGAQVLTTSNRELVPCLI